MISARPVTAASGRPPGDALGRRDQVGDDAEVLAGEHRAGAGEAGLDLVGDEDDVVRAAPVDQRRQEAVGAGTMKPPSPWIGSMMIGREVVGADLLLDDRDGLLGGIRPAQPVAERVRHRRAVDLRRRTGRSRSCTASPSRSAPSSGSCGRGSAWSNATTACFLVNLRAILIAFSTASAPELNSAVLFSWSPGVSG